MIHISFKQKKLRLQGHVVFLLKDRGVVVSAGRGTLWLNRGKSEKDWRVTLYFEGAEKHNGKWGGD